MNCVLLSKTRKMVSVGGAEYIDVSYSKRRKKVLVFRVKSRFF